MASFEEALIKQKLEFTLSQLEEYKQKEESLKKTNDSLLKALSDSNTTITSQASNEQQKRIDQLVQENSTLKSKIKDLTQKIEQEKHELSLSIRELDLSMKQQKVTFESEKLQLMGTIQKLEAENFNLTNIAKNSKKNDSQKSQISDLSKSFAREKEDLLNEIKNNRENYEKSIVELKTVYETENLNLRKNLTEIQARLRESADVIEELREKGNEIMENRTDELEYQIEYYKEMYLTASKTLSNKVSLAESSERQKLLMEIEALNVQVSKMSIELEKTQIDLKRQKMDFAKFQEKCFENERNLKNEIKILIGKLMKAKSKLGTDSELRETLKKENLTNRSNSSNRGRNNLSYY